MADKLNSVVIGEIVAKAMQNEDLKKSLLANPDKVLTEGGVVATGIRYKVVEDTATLKNIILPFLPLTDSMKLKFLPEGASPAQITRHIITKAQADEAYKKQVLSDINTVLQDLGVNLPQGISLNILANSTDLQYLVIPYVPPASGE
ncbi:MAG: nitrile hydratase subunit alpha, partial [Proteobacteria bacterium]|nr:nitrile hydratase subunit alpha [Pseudomonadota bacterium]